MFNFCEAFKVKVIIFGKFKIIFIISKINIMALLLKDLTQIKNFIVPTGFDLFKLY